MKEGEDKEREREEGERGEAHVRRRERIQTSTEEKRFRGSYFRKLTMTMVFTHHRTEENKMREDDDGSRGPHQQIYRGLKL